MRRAIPVLVMAGLVGAIFLIRGSDPPTQHPARVAEVVADKPATDDEKRFAEGRAYVIKLMPKWDAFDAAMKDVSCPRGSSDWTISPQCLSSLNRTRPYAIEMTNYLDNTPPPECFAGSLKTLSRAVHAIMAGIDTISVAAQTNNHDTMRSGLMQMAEGVNLQQQSTTQINQEASNCHLPRGN
jgi:hypothetical protein